MTVVCKAAVYESCIGLDYFCLFTPGMFLQMRARLCKSVLEEFTVI